MSDNIIISLDGMGGDEAPEVVVAGANIALKKRKNISFLIFGDENILEPIIDKFPKLKPLVTIRHTTESISAEEKPSVALRKGRNSSMALAFKAVKDNEAHCAVSAGNTGALMALAMFILRPIAGVNRPAICTSLPTKDMGTVSMLDLGANLEASAQSLLQFAIMGNVFARIIHGKQNPKLALLNIGEEEMKGKEEIKEASALLKDTDTINYTGYVEGTDIFKGEVDVIVTDGFTGNIALKTIEGTAGLISSIGKKTLSESIFGKLAILIGLPALIRLKKRLDPSNYNGAIMLGLNGIAVKSHGGTTACGFACAIHVAADLAERDCIQQLKDELKKVNL